MKQPLYLFPSLLSLSWPLYRAGAVEGQPFAQIFHLFRVKTVDLRTPLSAQIVGLREAE
jgi:hypothetical protein